MRPETVRSIADRCKAEVPREACGLVVGAGETERVVHARNTHPNPEQCFVVDPHSWLEAERFGDIRYVYHSHVNEGPMASDQDRACCDALQIPFAIYSVRTDDFRFLLPKPTWTELLGRPYVSGVSDCITLVADYYKIAHGIELALTDWRPDGLPDVGDDYIHVMGQAAGFREIPIEELKPGDCVSLRIRSRCPNGAAVYVGDGRLLLFLHQIPARLCDYDDRWKRFVERAYRHEALFDA